MVDHVVSTFDVLIGEDCRTHDLSPAAIIERDAHRHAVVLNCLLLCGAYLFLDIRRQGKRLADRLKPDIVRVNFLQFAADKPLEHPHQSRDLGLWPLPIFGRECIKRNGLYAEPRTRINDRAHRIGTCAMAKYSRLALQLCPTPVAVHDNGNVLRHPLRVDRREQFALGRVRFNYALKILEHSECLPANRRE